MTDEPWEHPDWYDLHDTDCVAGPGREPEHYKELLLSLPPLDRKDHLVDLGAGTGKVAAMVAESYPELARVTLVEPNGSKLRRARRRLGMLMGEERVSGIHAALGQGEIDSSDLADVATVGSVFMVWLELHQGTLGEGLDWLGRGLKEAAGLLNQGGSIFFAESLAVPWARGGRNSRCRRLHLPEFVEQLEAAGFSDIECTYRFRERVVVRAIRDAV